MTITTELILLLIGFFLSLFTFSLILGDNWLFRIAASLLSGTLSAYLLIVLIEKVFLPLVVQPLLSPNASLTDQITLVLVLTAAVLLFFKVAFRKKAGGNLVIAIVICIATAVTVLGIVNGTLVNLYRGLLAHALPEQGGRTLLSWVRISLLLLGVISSLVYTQHTVSGRLNGKNKPAASIGLHGFFALFGEIFVGIAFGAIFAGCFIASATILIDQIAGILSSGLEILQWVK